MIICFGDSWAAGAELSKYQHPFVHWVARDLNERYVNYGKEGNSLGIILYSLITRIAELMVQKYNRDKK
jgi:hypothetical protein